MKPYIALVLALGLLLPSCATAPGPRLQVGAQAADPARSRELLADFAKSLPPGSRVRVSIAGSRTVRGTLLKTTDTVIVIQPRGRVPEPLVEVPFSGLLSLEQEQPGGGTVRAVAIGAAVGAGAALGVIMILAALLSD